MRHLEEEPDDIKLAKANSQKRYEKKWPTFQEHATPITRADTRKTREAEAIEPPRPKGLAGSMRTRSSSDHNEDLQQLFSVRKELPSSEFYGSSTSRQASLGFSHETRTSTRLQDRDQKPRQLRQRISSPPISSWSKEHPDWTRMWHNSIIYPAMGKDRARVDMGDIEKLDDGEFLNDNLIVFYLRWLQDQLERHHPELASRIYFQNTFFYQKLSHPEKGMKGINYDAVKKWTSKVDLLSKDYIIIPINEHSHWYVAIICNAPKLLPGFEVTDHSQSQDTDGSPVKEHTSTDEVPKAAHVAALKQILESTGGGDVDVLMQEVRLDDKNSERTEALHPVSNGILGVRELTENDNPQPVNVASDILEIGVTKESHGKKTKRKSLPPQRKYNPKEFRIITLDSLGSSHTATCSNLKDYLVLEIKDKKNIEIQRPGSIGTTAKGIPLQNNYYDCGLFLLSYVEMFLKSPDEFISGILQSEPQDYQMPKALEKREQIRELLFQLQKEQHAEAAKLAKPKGKGKKSGKVVDNSGSAMTFMSSSQEASKNPRESPDRRSMAESGDTLEKATRPRAAPSTMEEVPNSNTSELTEPHKSSVTSKSDTLRPPASPVQIEVPKPEKPEQTHSLTAASNDSGKASGSMISGIFAEATKCWNGFLNHDKSATMKTSDSKSAKTHVDIIEVDGSPPKPDSGKSLPRTRNSEMEDSSKTLARESPDVFYAGPFNTDRVGSPRPTVTRHQRHKQNSRHSLTRHNGRTLASPTSNAMEISLRHPSEQEVQDLRFTSPEAEESACNDATKAQHPRSSVLEKANRSISENRERAVKASSPEVLVVPSSRVSDHRPFLYPVNRVRTSREVNDVAVEGFKSEVGESESEDRGEDPIDLVNTNSRSNGVSKTSTDTSASDDDMLLQPGNPQEEDVNDAESSLQSALTVSSSPSVRASKKAKEGAKSAPASPVLRSDSLRRSVFSSPSQGRKRKNPGSDEADTWQEISGPRQIQRDALEQAMIESRGQHDGRSGTHIRFNE
jgi:Ulp1 family protease